DGVARTFAVTALGPHPVAAGAAPAARGPAPATGPTRAGVLHVPLPGADLLLRRKSGVPTVSLGVYVPRLEFQPPMHAGLGALTVRSAVRGADGLDAGGLAFAAERLGGSLSAALNSDWLGIGFTVLADRLADAAALLDVLHRCPALADQDVAIERDLL